MAAIDESLTSFKVTNDLEIQEQEGVDLVSFRIPLFISKNLSVILIKDNINVLRVSTEQKGNIIEFRAEVLEKNLDMGNKNGSKGVITSEVMLLATIRYLAGGMKWDICLSLDIGFGSF
jgi:hypothetical protein